MADEQRKTGNMRWKAVSIITVCIAVPLTVILSPYLGDRHFYISGLLIIILSMVMFAAAFEKRRPQVREIVVIAVMCAAAAASRAAFIMFPQIKPVVGVIMITGIALGPSAGFLTGTVTAFVSNFLFGQGPWTPWQMFAYGAAGYAAGILAKKGVISPEKRGRTAAAGGAVVMLLTGPLLDTCTLFTMSSSVNAASAAAVYSAGLVFNAVLAVSTMVTLLLLCRPVAEKLERIKRKYGIIDCEG